MKFLFVDNEETKKGWIVTAENQHEAIGIAVAAGYCEDMKDFYYGLDDGQISIHEVEKEI